MDENMILQVKDLNITIPLHEGLLTPVRGVNFDMKKGETVGLVGESGCGKSLTCRAILAINEKKCRASGNILYNSDEKGAIDLLALDARGKEIRAIRGKEISMIFQEPMVAFSPLYTIGNQITEATLLHITKDKKKAKEITLDVMKKVGIANAEKRYNQYPHEFSGGMLQRAMISMALVCNPKILIADEPTTALDVTIQAQILKLMNDLKETTGTAIIFITHDLGVINEMADDVAVMYCGQVVEQAPADVIFRNCTESHPYTEGLMLSIPRLEIESERLEPIPGVVPHPLALPKGCKFGPRCKYCTQKCIDEEPKLTKVNEKQAVRCFYPNKEERNSAEHKKITVHY